MCYIQLNCVILYVSPTSSDGQGYSGVYVAVDIGIRSHEESSNSVVDVFEMAKKLRRDRQGIICSLEHFNFTYQVSRRNLVKFYVNVNDKRL